MQEALFVNHTDGKIPQRFTHGIHDLPGVPKSLLEEGASAIAVLAHEISATQLSVNLLSPLRQLSAFKQSVIVFSHIPSICNAIGR